MLELRTEIEIQSLITDAISLFFDYQRDLSIAPDFLFDYLESFFNLFGEYIPKIIISFLRLLPGEELELRDSLPSGAAPSTNPYQTEIEALEAEIRDLESSLEDCRNNIFVNVKDSVAFLQELIDRPRSSSNTVFNSGRRAGLLVGISTIKKYFGQPA